MQTLSPKPYKQAKRFFVFTVISNSAVLLVNFYVGLLLHSHPFATLAENGSLLTALATGTGLAAILFLLDRGVSLVETVGHRLAAKKATKYLLPAALLFLVATGCDQVSTSTKVLSTTQGSITNPATGLKASYRNLEASGVRLVMNEEVLNHTDIPIGEKFYIVNEGVKGLSVREGKVSVGCSLLITDEQGKSVLEVADLFSGNDVFNEKEVDYLRCGVSTGLPMESENHYHVKAKFWDKYGDGYLENTVTFRAIDMP